jgi:hypothetical protein
MFKRLFATVLIFAFASKLLAAEGGVLDGANYAQRTFSSTFSTPTGPLAEMNSTSQP